jgi:hypothetical protein
MHCAAGGLAQASEVEGVGTAGRSIPAHSQAVCRVPHRSLILVSLWKNSMLLQSAWSRCCKMQYAIPLGRSRLGLPVRSCDCRGAEEHTARVLEDDPRHLSAKPAPQTKPPTNLRHAPASVFSTGCFPVCCFIFKQRLRSCASRDAVAWGSLAPKGPNEVCCAFHASGTLTCIAYVHVDVWANVLNQCTPLHQAGYPLAHHRGTLTRGATLQHARRHVATHGATL